MFAVEVKNISKKFDSISALKNISITVEEGEMFSIVCPDGAGKSTLIRLMCGILKPDNGEIFIFGLNTIVDKNKIKNQI